VIWSDQFLHAVPYIRKSLHLENTQGSLQSGKAGSVPTMKYGGGSVMICAEISWYKYRGTVFCWPQYYRSWPNYCKGVSGQVGYSGESHVHFFFTNNFAFFQPGIAPPPPPPPFTQLELFSRGMKSMNVNLNIFLGRHNHQI
jgi:hypothetical protein